MTSTGLIIGSCAYMAAERFAGGQVGPPADIYSLTCLLYECLTGRAPFETGGDLRQLMSAHMFSPPPRPSIMRRGITRAFDDVIARGMAKKPGDRYSSAGELAKAATAAAGRGPAGRARRFLPPSPPSSTRQFSAIYENPSGTGYTPYPPQVQAARADAQPRPPRRVAFRPDAGGAGGGDGRAVRRGRGAGVGVGRSAATTAIRRRSPGWPRRRLRVRRPRRSRHRQPSRQPHRPHRRRRRQRLRA